MKATRQFLWIEEKRQDDEMISKKGDVSELGSA